MPKERKTALSREVIKKKLEILEGVLSHGETLKQACEALELNIGMVIRLAHEAI